MPTTQRDTRLTYEDFVHFPDDGMRHELIDGVHYVTPSPAFQHQVLLGRIHLAIGNLIERHPELGMVLLSPFDIVFTPWDVVEPDLMFIAADQMAIVTKQNLQGAPALVVEIVSPSTRKRDLGIKRELFDRGGVREYWVVDPKGLVVTVYRRQADGGLVPVVALSAGDAATLSTPLLPGFKLSLAKLFA